MQNQDSPGRRPRIAFFDYADVFEDFYNHYGVTQEAFATRWAESGNHQFLRTIQQDVGDVVWYCFSLKPELTRARHDAGFELEYLKSSWLHLVLWNLYYMPAFAWRYKRAYPLYAFLASYSASFSLAFMRELRRNRPDYIFVQDYSNGRFDLLVAVAGILRIPLVAYHSGSRPEGYVGRFLKHWTIRRADRLILSSRREMEMLAGEFHVPRGRMKVVLTPIDTETFRPIPHDQACVAAVLDPARRYLLFVGRLEDQVKRVSSLIRTFGSMAADYPDVDFLIAGDGPDRDALSKLACQTAPGRIRMLGWISDSLEKANLYNSAECLMLASRSEGFPTVVGEAMACGTPVLASNVGGISELVTEGESGWLFEAGDEAGLKRAMTAVLQCPERVAAMRGPIRTLAENRISPLAIGTALRECFSVASGS